MKTNLYEAPQLEVIEIEVENEILSTSGKTSDNEPMSVTHGSW